MTSDLRSELELISLAELIEQVKRDLLGSPADTPPTFWIEEVRIEAKVVARRTGTTGGKAGLSLSVIGLKADAGIAAGGTWTGELTQTVSIKLSPLSGREDYLAQLDEEQRRALRHEAAAAMVRGGGSTGDDV